MAITRKRRVHEIAPRLPAAADQRHRHRQRGLVVVLGPATVQVDADVARRLAQHPFHQVVAQAEGARQAASRTEDAGPLPGHEERHHAAQRGAGHHRMCGIAEAAKGGVHGRLELGHDGAPVFLVARPRVFGFAVARVDAHDDHFVDQTHRVQTRHRLVDVPLVAAERFVGKEQVLAVLHIDHRVPLEPVLGVARWQVDARLVVAMEQPRPELHQRRKAAGGRRPKVRVVRLRPVARQYGQPVGTAGPGQPVTATNEGLEVQPRSLRRQLEDEGVSVAGDVIGFDVVVPVVGGAKHDVPGLERIAYDDRPRIHARHSTQRAGTGVRRGQPEPDSPAGKAPARAVSLPLTRRTNCFASSSTR